MTNQFEEVFHSLNSQQQEIIGVDTLIYLAVKVEDYLKIGPKEYLTNKDENLSFLASSSHIMDKRNLSLYFKINREA